MSITQAKYRVKTDKGYEQFYLETSSNAVIMKNGESLQSAIDKMEGLDLTKVTSNIVPAVPNLEIGSPSNRFKSIYVDEAYLSTNTLYLGDTPVMGTESDTIMIRSDKDQSINMRTTGVGSSKIISENNVELSTSGPNADVIVQAKGQGSRAVLSAENSVEMNAKQVKIVAETLLEGLTRTKSLSVDGDLIVSGDSFTVNTTTVTTKDNIIEINKGQVGSGVSAGQAGLRVDRGDAEDFLMVFDETDDRFKVGTANSLQTLATHTYVNDEINKNKHSHSNKDVLDQLSRNSQGELLVSGAPVYTHPVVKKAWDLGNGANTSFTIPHGFGTDDLIVTIREKATGQIVYVDCVINTTNIVVSFGQTPTANQYRLVVLNG